MINNKRLRGCNPFTIASNTTRAHVSVESERVAFAFVKSLVCSFETFRKLLALSYVFIFGKGSKNPSILQTFARNSLISVDVKLVYVSVVVVLDGEIHHFWGD